MVVVSAAGVSKTFGTGAAAVHAVTDADLVLHAGEIVALIGSSGGGKSTLLSLLVGWERPDTGEIVVHSPADGPSNDPARVGWDVLAVLPQALGLLDDITIRSNVLLPARARGLLSAMEPRADQLMERLRVAHLGARFPSEVSLGEQQRAGLARTLLLSPRLLVADEPTAHQDRASIEILIDTLRDEARNGMSILLATHDAGLTTAADRVVRMRDGRLSEDAA